MAVAADFRIEQFNDGLPNHVIGFDGSGDPALFGVFETDEIGLVPAPGAGDVKNVLFGDALWHPLATSISDNELVRYEADTGAFVGIEVYSSTTGQVQLGNNVDTFGELRITAGSHLNRRITKRFGLEVLATAAGVTVLTGIPNNSVILMKFIGAGITEVTSPGAEAFAGEVAAVFRVDNSGTITQVGTDQSPVPVQENQGTGAPVLTFAIGGSSIQAVVSNPSGGVGSYRIVGFIEYVIVTAS